MKRIRTVSPKGNHKDNEGKFVPSPFISIGGKSVANAGFAIGDKVEILSEYGFITIRLIKISGNLQEKETTTDSKEAVL